MLSGHSYANGASASVEISSGAPRWVGEYAERVLAAHGNPGQLMTVFTRSPVPTVVVDDRRRCLEANRPARSALGLSLHELRRLRVDDITPPYLRSRLDARWDQLLEAGTYVGHPCEPAEADGNFLGLTFCVMANVLPGHHVIAFVPSGWSLRPSRDRDRLGSEVRGQLTRRERQVLELAADGLNGPRIAEELVLSMATVRTHFGHIYRKLDVPDRAAAIAKAMRLGLIR